MQNKFVPPKPLSTPVLFLVFNRPETTKQVFEAIRKAKPPKLFVAADGPRPDKPGEEEKCEQVRKIIERGIDWDCEVYKLYRDKNLGCKIAVSSAITWFFENVEMGIILEDDCLPSLSFFWFCEELLERYRDDLRIWHISGNNFHFGWKRDSDYSYYFGGIYGSIWGWATWRNRWKHYSVDMKNYDEVKTKGYLENCYDGSNAVKSRINDFECARYGLDTWDFQWVYTRWINNGLTIIPIVNLVKNIGFSEDATHTAMSKSDKRVNMDIFDIKLPLNHPPFVIRDSISENKFYNDFMKPSFLSKCKRIIKKLIKK